MVRLAGPLTVGIALFICALPSRAAADWLITPFLGSSFAPETTFLIPELTPAGPGSAPAPSLANRLTFGASVALLGDGFLGLEADVAHTPRFFEGDDPRGLVLTSRVTTVSGNVIVAVPLAVTRESLRPYVVGGLGLMQARTKSQADVFNVDKNLLGVSIGGGALGFLNDRTGLRFDLRYIKAASGEGGPFARLRPGVSRLSFWRATAGVVLRY